MLTSRTSVHAHWSKRDLFIFFLFFLLSLRLLPLVASVVMNYASIIYELIIAHGVIKSLNIFLEDMMSMKQLSNETAIPPCSFVLFALLLKLSFKNGNLDAQGLWKPEQISQI